MSVNTETTRPPQRTKIDVDQSPAPPWSGVKFVCAKCTAVWQLEAADVCTEIHVDGPAGQRDFKTPPCPAPGCGCVNAITIKEFGDQKMEIKS